MRRGGLRDLVVGLRLHRVHEVRKFDAVLDKEYREIVADQIVIALLCIEFRGKSAYVAHGVCRAAGPATVEKRTNTGVRRPGVVRNFAAVKSDSHASYGSK